MNKYMNEDCTLNLMSHIINAWLDYKRKACMGQ